MPSAADVTLQNLVYSYDANANITGILDEKADENAIYSYDALNRLTSGIVTDAGQSELLNEIFTYNSDTGSMASKNGEDFSYDLSHAHAVSSYGGNSYTYDANGNQVLRELDGENLTLVYDAENRLIEVTSDQPFTPEEINWAGQERQAAETETATPTVTETPTFLVTVIHL